MEEDLETMLQERFPDADDEEATVVLAEPQDDELVLLIASFPSSSDEFDLSTDPELEGRKRISVVDSYPRDNCDSVMQSFRTSDNVPPMFFQEVR